MMKSNAIQSDLIVVQYQPFDSRYTMKTFSFDFLYTVVGHVKESQFIHGTVGTKYV